MERYLPAILEKDPDSDWSIYFPDLPGCIAVGDTTTDAMENGRHALALHLEGMIAEGQAIPEVDATAPNAFAGAIDVARVADGTQIATILSDRADKGRAVKRNLTFNEHLVRRVERAAEARGLSLSAYLSEAASEKMTRDRGV